LCDLLSSGWRDTILEKEYEMNTRNAGTRWLVSAAALLLGGILVFAVSLSFVLVARHLLPGRFAQSPSGLLLLASLCLAVAYPVTFALMSKVYEVRRITSRLELRLILALLLVGLPVFVRWKSHIVREEALGSLEEVKDMASELIFRTKP
jgi:hypothetical protein